MSRNLLIGSANLKKAHELAVLLEGLPWKVLSLRDFPDIPAPEETGATLRKMPHSRRVIMRMLSMWRVSRMIQG